MHQLSTIAGIEYGILEASELSATAALLASAFGRHEPLSLAVGLSQSEIEALVSAFAPKALDARLTIVARTESDRELVGALLTEDFDTPLPEEFAEIAPKSAPIGALLESLDTQYRSSRTMGMGEYLHLLMLGVADRASGRGIARNLIEICLENGKNRGFRYAVAEATGSISQHVFRSLGFREVLTARYSDFLFADTRPFAGIKDPIGTILMDRALELERRNDG